MSSRVITRDYFVLADRELTQLSYPGIFEQDQLSSEAFQKALAEKEKHWEIRIEHVRNSSLREGYQAGLEEGKSMALREYQEIATRLQTMISDIEAQVEKQFVDLQPVIAELVFKLAGKVLQVPVERKELKQQVADDIQQALRELSNKSQITISVSASDYETIEPLLRRGGDKGYIDISLHNDLKPGEYCIETPNEIIEKNFSKILARLNKSYQLSLTEKQSKQPSDEDEHVKISH